MHSHSSMLTSHAFTHMLTTKNKYIKSFGSLIYCQERLEGDFNMMLQHVMGGRKMLKAAQTSLASNSETDVDNCNAWPSISRITLVGSLCVYLSLANLKQTFKAKIHLGGQWWRPSSFSLLNGLSLNNQCQRGQKYKHWAQIEGLILSPVFTQGKEKSPMGLLNGKKMETFVKTTCISSRVAEEISTMSHTVLRFAKISTLKDRRA